MPSKVNGTHSGRWPSPDDEYRRPEVGNNGSKAQFEARVAAIDEEIRALLTQAEPSLQPFYGMMLYHLGLDADRPKGGKRLRPVLCSLVFEAIAGDGRPAMPAAAAIELLHNFTLIHDDIEDQDPRRHHQPTACSPPLVSPCSASAGAAFRRSGSSTSPRCSTRPAYGCARANSWTSASSRARTSPPSDTERWPRRRRARCSPPRPRARRSWPPTIPACAGRSRGSATSSARRSRRTTTSRGSGAAPSGPAWSR